jgi:hypothetical protein
MTTDLLGSFVWESPKDGFQLIEAAVLNDGDPRLRRVPGLPLHCQLVDSRGHATQPAKSEYVWILTNDLPIGTRYIATRYLPFAEFSALFRDFADTATTPEGILAFANQYGLLGFPPRRALVPSDQPKMFVMIKGEMLKDWIQQIQAMRNATTLWDMIRSDKRADLAKIISWQQSREERVAGWYHGIQLIPGVPDTCTSDDVITPALSLLRNWINDFLVTTVSPRMQFEPARRELGLRLLPSTLLAALWLQLARAVSGNRDFHVCKKCGRWFELSNLQSEHRTVRRLFCTDACKSADYRDSKKKAQELSAQHRSPKQIADELGKSVERVKAWTKKRK